jgi:hypothetical protein
VTDAAWLTLWVPTNPSALVVACFGAAAGSCICRRPWACHIADGD